MEGSTVLSGDFGVATLQRSRCTDNRPAAARRGLPWRACTGLHAAV